MTNTHKVVQWDMRKISISTSFDYSVGIDEQIAMIKDAGFSHLSIGGNYEHSGILERDRLLRLKELIAGHGLMVDTIHGYALDKADAPDVNERVVQVAVELGASVIVLHCSSFAFRSDTYEERKRDLEWKLPKLEDMAREYNIKFAFENVLPGVATDFMEDILNQANPDYFGFCYDSAHDQIGGPRSSGLLERLSGRLLALHISDRVKEFVDHVTPGEGFIDFDELCLLLKRANIAFPLLMEVMVANSKYKEHGEFLRVTYNKASELYDKIFN